MDEQPYTTPAHLLPRRRTLRAPAGTFVLDDLVPLPSVYEPPDSVFRPGSPVCAAGGIMGTPLAPADPGETLTGSVIAVYESRSPLWGRTPRGAADVLWCDGRPDTVLVSSLLALSPDEAGASLGSPPCGVCGFGLAQHLADPALAQHHRATAVLRQLRPDDGRAMAGG